MRHVNQQRSWGQDPRPGDRARPEGDARGILRPGEGRRRFTLARVPPSDDLADLVEFHWRVGWDLAPGEGHVQEVLPHPSVHVVAQDGELAVFGTPRGIFARRLEGRGHAVATKFRPGAFRVLFDRPATALVGATLPGREVFGPAADDVARRLARGLAHATGARTGAHATGATVGAPAGAWERDLLENLVRAALADGREREAHAVPLRVVRTAFDRILTPGLPEVRRVDHLAAETGTTVRRLQRIFAEYVGVTPKWVLMRHRVHLAAELIARDPGCDLAEVALELGYSDQAHFTGDFAHAVGCPPAAYAARCRAADGGAGRALEPDRTSPVGSGV